MSADRDIPQRFLATLFADYAPDEALRLEIRPLHPLWRREELYPNGGAPDDWACRTPWGARQWFLLTETGIVLAARHALTLARKYEVYFGVLPRIGRTGKQQNVDRAMFLWCDVDGGEEGVEGARRLLRKAIAGGLPEPALVVVSGNGLHVYWRLTAVVEICDADARFQFKMLLKRLCVCIGGKPPAAHADCSRADTASILRVPETFNNKAKEAPRPVLLDTYAPDVLSFRYLWWQAFLPALPAPPPPRPLHTGTLDMNAYEGLLRWAARGYAEGARHQELVSATAWLVRTVRVPKDIALELLTIKAAASPGARPITRDELEAMIRWA